MIEIHHDNNGNHYLLDSADFKMVIYKSGLVWIPKCQPIHISDVPSTNDVECCERWINRFVSPKKTINKRISSYGLKHAVERWGEMYIPNGAFIQAAINLGYRYKTRQDRMNVIGMRTTSSINAYFNMSFPRRRSEEYKLSRI